jgi:ArsR family transcriptional regulator
VDNGADVLFRSLGDPGRRMVARVVAEESLTVGEISEVLGLPQSTVSRHLKTLRSTGLLVDRREGNRVFIGLAEPNGHNGTDLTAVLNSWLRNQDLAPTVAIRLRRTVASRAGNEDPFERLAHQWDELRFEHFGGLFHIEALASLLPAEWRVLDVGTGTGYLLPFLARHFQSVTAADASAAMLDVARQRAAREGLSNVRFELGRIEDLPLEEASIDCVLALLVLRYSADLGRSVGELARVTSDNGRLLVVDIVPHGMEDFRRRIGDSSGGLDPRKVTAELRKAGFRIMQSRIQSPSAIDPSMAPTRPAPDLFLVTAEKKSRHETHGSRRRP